MKNVILSEAKNLTMRALSFDAGRGLVRPLLLCEAALRCVARVAALRVTDPSVLGMGSDKEGE
jgi:hypothetical protein